MKNLIRQINDLKEYYIKQLKLTIIQRDEIILESEDMFTYSFEEIEQEKLQSEIETFEEIIEKLEKILTSNL